MPSCGIVLRILYRLPLQPPGAASLSLDTSCAGSPDLKETTMLNYLQTDRTVPAAFDNEGIGRPRAKKSRAETPQRSGKWRQLRLSERSINVDQVDTEFVHTNRVATMGHLAASIAHEVKQPIAATITNAEAALRFLDAPSVNLGRVREILKNIVDDGTRASDVISRIYCLSKK